VCVCVCVCVCSRGAGYMAKGLKPPRLVFAPTPPEFYEIK